MKLIDSHCHLDMINLDSFNQDISRVISSAQTNQIEKILNISVNLSTFAQVIETANRFEHVNASVGIHPCYDQEAETTIDELNSLVKQHSKIVAIGECGLDYHMNNATCPRDDDFNWQRERFRTHIQAAKQANLPLIIHTRDAIKDTIEIMLHEDAAVAGGVMHCYVEDMENAKKAMDMNFYISFSGIVTFKSARALQQVAKQIPDDRLLIETDSPYLAPMPYRGKANQPAYVLHVAEFLAQLRNTTIEHIAEITYNNYSKLFL